MPVYKPRPECTCGACCSATCGCPDVEWPTIAQAEQRKDAEWCEKLTQVHRKLLSVPCQDEIEFTIDQAAVMIADFLSEAQPSELLKGWGDG